MALFQFSMVECVLASLTDEFSSTIRKSTTRTYIFRIVLCTIFFCCGLPFVTNVSKVPNNVTLSKIKTIFTKEFS